MIKLPKLTKNQHFILGELRQGRRLYLAISPHDRIWYFQERPETFRDSAVKRLLQLKFIVERSEFRLGKSRPLVWLEINMPTVDKYTGL